MTSTSVGSCFTEFSMLKFSYSETCIKRAHYLTNTLAPETRELSMQYFPFKLICLKRTHL